VKLASRRLLLACPADLPPSGLHAWVLGQLHDEGEPLRWAITSVHRTAGTTAGTTDASAVLALQVEAVLIQ